MTQDGGVGGGGGGAARAKCFPVGWNEGAKPCDYCKSAAALIYCVTESTLMCTTCDAKVHDDAISLRHERVWMCEVWDRNIHSANPLARPHERSPIVPIYDTGESMMKSASVAATYLLPVYNHLSSTETKMGNATDNWITSNPITSKFSDQFLGFEYPISADSIVPVQTIKPAVPTKLTDYSSENPLEIDFTKSNINSYNSSSYTITTPSFTVSSSSLDVGVVPDGSTVSDISFPIIRGNEASHMVGLGMDREARVLRYKEKRKKRKFDKTVRYASRKAYAETRPRIKGRFAKRTEVHQSDTDRLTFSSFSANLIADYAGFGAVPSF